MAEAIRSPGETAVFVTGVAWKRTELWVGPYPGHPDEFFPEVTYHIELCCEDDHLVTSIPVDISRAAGALVTVRVHNAEHQARIQVRIF